MTTFLITGANRGIGLELTRQALARGDSVIAAARDAGAQSLDALAAKAAGRLQTIALDVVDEASVKAAATSLAGRAIDVLINNAGIIGPDRQSPLDMDFGGLAQTLAVNTIAPLRVTQALLPNLRKSNHPRIVTISSAMGSLSSAASDRIAYRASKAAVNKIMQGLASDLKRENIPAIVMHPGWVRTDMGGAGADLSPEQSASGILQVIDRLTLASTGAFINYDGKTLPW
ncbi:MAG: SDR family oxidoreductase [Beijerinckiaceae bacterium]|nr:SDR family oxidoreductase [Beijerinckiaceae bacterium]